MLNNPLKYLHRTKHKIVSHAKIILIKCVGLFRSYPLEESMMIVGEPRSGSTWLMELLVNYRKCIIVWEPLHPTLGVNPLSLKGEPRIFEDPSHVHSSIAKHITGILTLKIINNWTLIYTSFRSIFLGSSTLTKFVHATLLLPWILNNVNLKYKPIYIIRHPVAAALSQIKGGMGIEQEMMSDKTFKYVYPAHHEEYRKFIGTLNNQLEKLIAMWCLYHKYLISHLNRGDKIILIYYEELLMNPVKELEKICAAWNIHSNIDPLTIRKPSQTDFHKQLKKDPHEQLSKWQHQISIADKDRVQNILDYFEIRLYNVNDVFPNKSQLNHLT